MTQRLSVCEPTIVLHWDEDLLARKNCQSNVAKNQPVIFKLLKLQQLLFYLASNFCTKKKLLRNT